MNVSAVELLDFTKSDLGIRWGAKIEELQAQYPGLIAIGLPGSFQYTGPLRIDSISVDNGFMILILDDKGGLTELEIILPNTNSLDVVRLLQREVGGGDTASYPVGKVFQHFFEWIKPGYSIEFKYVASSAIPFEAPPATDRGSMLEISREPPNVSSVESAKTYPAELERMRQLLEGHETEGDPKND